MRDATYERFVQRWEEVTDLKPQAVGRFTPLFKRVVCRFKVMPWPWLMLIGLMISFLLYMLFGSSISFIATTLQRGF